MVVEHNLNSVKSMFTPHIERPGPAPAHYGGAGKAGRAVALHGDMKPNVGFSVGQGLESVIDNHDREADAFATTLDANAGSYSTRSSTGLYAKATTAEAGAHYSVFSANARGPSAQAGLHNGANLSAYASADVARAEASAGPVTVGVGLSASTGVSVGVDGASASFLGFGVTVGPRMAIKTPVIDLGCTVM